MIQSFVKSSFTSSFKDNEMPRLLSASYITMEFSQHSRILHKHDDRFELLFIRTGSGSYIVDDQRYDISAGDIIICNAGVLHDEIPSHNHELSMLSLAIDKLILNGLPENHLIASNIKPILRIEKHFTLLDTILQSIFNSLSHESEDYHETNQYLSWALLSLLISIFRQHGEVIEPTNEDPLLQDIKHYIDDNYSEDLTLQKISEQFFISSSYLSHLFKKKLGYSPMHYIVRRRIGEAQSLLITSDKSITDIAALVGFDNLSHFNVQFKKYVGLPPLSYRKRYTLPESNV